MGIKLVACDLDGTLLNDNRIITKRTLDAIKKIQDKGIKFVICTGREQNSVKEIKKKYGLTCGAILMNGACYMDENNQLDLFKPIPYEKVKEIIDTFDKVQSDFTILTSEGIRSRHTYEELIDNYIEHVMEIGWASTYEQAKKEIEEDNFFIGAKKFESLKELKDVNVLKIENHQNYTMEITLQAAKMVEKIEGISIVHYPGGNVEITALDAKKGNTLFELSEKLHLSISEVMPFGDEDNDYSMISRFPSSVAMKNGNERIKAVAGRISKYTNDEDGVARILETL